MESIDNGVKFSYIKTETMAGNYAWVLTATDAGGRTLTMRMPFKASTNATVSGTMSLNYSDIDRKVTAVNISTADGVSGDDMPFYGIDGDSKSLILQAWVTPTDATDSKILWNSSNDSVLRVSSSESLGDGMTLGRFTITGVGTAVITASAHDGSGKKLPLRLGIIFPALN